MFKNIITGLIFAVASASAFAVPFHYLAGAGDADPTGPITAAGHTPMALTNLAAADLSGAQVVWITNGNNGAPPTQVTLNLTALSNWVSAGGVLSYHDRYVSDGQFDMSQVLPGAAGTNFVRDFSADIDLLDLLHPVVAGLNNGSLDGGNFSSHGYADLASLPAGAVSVLSRGGAPSEIVDFYYQFGLGWVYYSTIPLDFYLAGSGNNPPRDNLVNTYAVNEAAFQASLSTQSVPEPGTVMLLGVGLALLGFRKNKRA